jgi:hypothetical protein
MASAFPSYAERKIGRRLGDNRRRLHGTNALTAWEIAALARSKVCSQSLGARGAWRCVRIGQLSAAQGVRPRAGEP